MSLLVKHYWQRQNNMGGRKELTEEEVVANLAKWNADADRYFKDRASHFAQIDELTVSSGVLERYAQALAEAGLKGYFEFGVSDAQENAYGMGYPILTRTIMLISEDLMETGEPPMGATIFQINRGGGFEEPLIEFLLNENETCNFAKRYEGLSDDQRHTRQRPYWLRALDINAFDITQPSHLRPGQLFVDGRDTAFMFGGNSGKAYIPAELVASQTEINDFFKGITEDLREFAPKFK